MYLFNEIMQWIFIVVLISWVLGASTALRQITEAMNATKDAMQHVSEFLLRNATKGDGGNVH